MKLKNISYSCSCPAGDGLGSKEIIWALQQIARLDAQGLVDVSTKKQFEDCFLEMLYKLCTTAELPPVLYAAAYD